MVVGWSILEGGGGGGGDETWSIYQYLLYCKEKEGQNESSLQTGQKKDSQSSIEGGLCTTAKKVADKKALSLAKLAYFGVKFVKFF